MEIKSLVKTQTATDSPVLAVMPATRPSYSAEAESGSLVDYWHTIWSRKYMLAAYGVIGLGIGVGASLLQSPTYVAKTSIEIQDSKDDNMASKILNPQPELPAVESTGDIQTQIKILQSRTLIERALDQAQISSLADLGAENSMVARLFRTPSASSNDKERLIEKVTKNLKVTGVSETRIVELSYEAKDPAIAARFVNQLTSEFMEQNIQARGEMNHKTSEWLVSQLNDVRSTLQNSEDALQRYARKKGLIYTGDKGNVSEEKLRELQTSLLAAQADRVDKQAKYEIAQKATPESVPEALNDPNLRAMESNLTELRKQDAEMAVTFKPDYSKAKKLHVEIASLESSIEAKRALIVRLLSNELDQSRRREQLLEVGYAKQTRLVTNDSENSIQYDVLKHDVDTNRQIYQTILQRVKESTITSALKAPSVRVIDPAKAPLHPSQPNLPVNAGVGMFAGLLFAFASLILRSKMNGTVQEPGDAEKLLGIPELGVIPSDNSGSSSIFARLSGKSEPKDRSMGLISQPGKSPLIADSFRALVTSILFAGARQRQRVLVVTGASPGEGKTMTASNLAVAFAKLGRKVLLIDADTRNPNVHTVFGLDNSTGLTNTLKKAAVNDTHSDTFVRETSVPKLFVLTSGPALQESADLLFSSTMPNLINRYRDEYEIVLIDTPPMMVMPDARILGSFADGVILIASAGKTERAAIQAAYRRFVEDRTSVLGVVLNNWDSKSSIHGYYNTYKEPVTELALMKVASPKAMPV